MRKIITNPATGLAAPRPYPHLAQPGTTYPALVGGVLAQMRSQQNLRQEEVADAVGVTQAT